jgi:hypothetical protein
MPVRLNYGLDQAPHKDASRSLEAIIRALLPSATEDQITRTMGRIGALIDDYRESFPILEDGRRHRGSLKEARRNLRDLAAGRTSSEGAPHSFLAHRMLLKQGNRKRNPTLPALAVSDFAAKALAHLAERDDHEVDEHREVFACEIARTLLDLGLPASMTRDDPHSRSVKGRGAAYARLLRASLRAAGGNPPTDILPLMRAGKRLLDATTGKS